MLLLIMAIRRQIPATVSISADTGWENERLWNTGRKSSNREYFDEVVVPLCKGSHVVPRFVRSVDEYKKELIPLRMHVLMSAVCGETPMIPMFGSRGGRLMQSCTDKMKIRACRQEARRLGAVTNCNAQGIHRLEADRRIKGRFLRMDGEFAIYQTTIAVNVTDIVTGEKVKKIKDIKWQSHYYPLVDLRMDREDVYKEVESEGIPYLISSECDLCPHKDLARWERTPQRIIEEGAQIERLFEGKYFFTSLRIPLKDAICEMKKKRSEQPEADFGCGNSICGL